MLACRALPRLQQPFRPYPNYAVRLYSTTKLSNGITLAYDLHEPPAENDGSQEKNEDAPPILFIHGLFGSKKNNRSMSKVLARDLKRPVYTMDMRNHGDSSHNPRHDYSALAEDVELFIQHHKLKPATLIGHSMGAKTVMAVALRNRVPIANLIPVDNAPVDAALHSDFQKYTQGMRKIEESTIKRQSEADAILQDYEESLAIRQFLLANLQRNADGVYKWQIPVKILTKELDSMADFPFTEPDEVRYEGPTLVIRGTKSHYVADEMLPTVGRFFPKFELVDVDSGHWVTSENPQAFRTAVVEWLQDKD